MKRTWSLLLVAALAVLLTGCPGKRPHVDPKPPDQPPVVDEVPAPGQVYGLEMLLRTDGPRLANGVQLFGAIQCCEGFTSNSRWPLASESWMDHVKGFGANAIAFRVGPFYGDAEHESEWADLGGGYVTPAGEWNERYWREVRRLVHAAYERRMWVRVALIDTWYCKHAQWGDQQMPWSDDDVQACGRRPSVEQERWLRKVVSEIGGAGNVYWVTDNEGGEIQAAKREWYDWVRFVVRDAEAKVGVVHIIGTNNPDHTAGFDFASTHNRSPLLQPINGLWTENDERNPAFSPEQEASHFAQARERGLAYWYWRAGQTDEEMAKTLGLFRDVAQGGAATECFAPDAEDPGWRADGVPDSCATMPALRAAQAEVGDRRALWPASGTPEQRFAAMFESLDALAASMRRQGLCASRTRDAITARTQDMPAGVYDELHAVAATDGGYTLQPCVGRYRYAP